MILFCNDISYLADRRIRDEEVQVAVIENGVY